MLKYDGGSAKMMISGVKNIKELLVAKKLGFDKITYSIDILSNWNPIELKEKMINSEAMLGIKFNPFIHSVEDFCNIAHDSIFKYIQIEYSSRECAESLKIKEIFKSSKQFFCDGIIADTDSDPSWVEGGLHDAAEWGFQYCFVNLYTDEDVNFKKSDFSDLEFTPSGLIELSKIYSFGVCGSFSSSNIKEVVNIFTDQIEFVFQIGKNDYFDQDLTLEELIHTLELIG